MSRARLDNLNISRRQGALIGAMVITVILLVVLVIPSYVPPARMNQSGIQFYKDGQPVGNPVYGQGWLPGGWHYAGEEVDAAELCIVWQADVPEDHYVDITFRYGVWTGTSFPHVKTYSHEPRSGQHEVTYNLYNIDTTGLSDGDIVVFGGTVEFACYRADGTLVNSAGDRIEVTLTYRSDDGYTGDFLLASITITPFAYEPPPLNP